MGLNQGELDELLGAWALGALDPDELTAIDQALADDPDQAPSAPTLSALVALMGESRATAPPPDLRAALLIQAAASAPVQAEPSDPVTVLANQIEVLHQLLVQLSDDDWSAPARPYPWSVHGLVAHLLVIERYTARQLGLTADGPTAEQLDHLAMGADEIEAELARRPDDTAQSWYEAARLVVDGFQPGPDAQGSGALGPGSGAQGPDLDSIVTMHGWPFSIRGLLVARSFELWTHADDVRRATGRPLVSPATADVRAMSQFSVSTLPLVLSLDTQAPPLPATRLVLTGGGGGTFDLGRRSPQTPEPGTPEPGTPQPGTPQPGTDRGLLMVLDVVDYCRLVARRAELDDVASTIEGDRKLVDQLVAAAQVLAV